MSSIIFPLMILMIIIFGAPLSFEILRPQNDYLVLNVTIYASQAEIKHAYRALIRAIHTDKCKDPRADEASKRLNRARDNLLKPQEQFHQQKHSAQNDHERRKNNDAQNDTQSNNDQNDNDYGSFTDGFWFRESKKEKRYRRMQEEREREEYFSEVYLALSLVPIIMIVLYCGIPYVWSLVVAVAQVPWSLIPAESHASAISFIQTPKYPILRRTDNFTPYYVHMDFDASEDLKLLEAKIEKQYNEIVKVEGKDWKKHLVYNMENIVKFKYSVAQLPQLKPFQVI